MYFKAGYPSLAHHPQQQTDVSYNRSRLQLTPNSNFNQKGASQYTVKNSRRDTTPSKESKDFFYPKSGQKAAVKQFPVQMQHIRLNQLEENYASQHQNHQVMQSVDMTPQRHIGKGQTNYNNNFMKQQQGSISQLHNSNESQQINRINVNLSLKQFQQNPLKQINQNSCQKTPAGSSTKASQPQYHQVAEDPQCHTAGQRFGLQKENLSNDLQQQVQDLRRQKENICITLSETFKKNQTLTIQVQDLQKQLQEESQQQNDIDCLQDKVIELTNANSNLSNINSQYAIKLSQLESQVRSNRQMDLKKIQDLTEESTRLNQNKQELEQEAKELRKNRNEVLEMNQSLENELKEAGGQYVALQNDANFLQDQLQELYQENQQLKEVKTSKGQDPQIQQLMDGQKLVANSIISDQKNLQFRINDSMDTDISDHHSMQINQLNGMIDMLKNENTILYTALNRQCLSN